MFQFIAKKAGFVFINKKKKKEKKKKTQLRLLSSL